WERQIRRIVVVRRLETRLHALWMIRVRRKGDLLNRLRTIGRAADVELAWLPLEILLARFEEIRGDLPRSVANLPCRHRASRAGGLGEAGDTDAHQLAARALLRLLASQIPVTDPHHRQLERGLVVPAVVGPARRRAIGELFRAYEVLQPELGGIDIQLVRGDVS